MQLSHMLTPEKKRKHLVIYSFLFFFSLTVFEEVSTNSPVADLKYVGPTEILFLTTELSRILEHIFCEEANFFFSLDRQGEFSDIVDVRSRGVIIKKIFLSRKNS